MIPTVIAANAIYSLDDRRGSISICHSTRQREGAETDIMNNNMIDSDPHLPPGSPTSVLSITFYKTNNKQSRGRRITWADEAKKPLESIRLIPPRELRRGCSPGSKSLVILLLSASRHKYEFICCEYKDAISENVGKLSVKDILKQLPAMASNACLERQEYTALCRQDNTELINALAVQDYDLQHFEMLWAVPKGYTSKELAPVVSCLLSNKGVLRAIRCSQFHREMHELQVPTRSPATVTTTLVDADDEDVEVDEMTRNELEMSSEDELERLSIPAHEKSATPEENLLHAAPTCNRLVNTQQYRSSQMKTIFPPYPLLLNFRSLLGTEHGSLFHCHLPVSIPKLNFLPKRQHRVTLFSGTHALNRKLKDTTGKAHAEKSVGEAHSELDQRVQRELFPLERIAI